MNPDPEPPEAGQNTDVSRFAGQRQPKDVPPPLPIPDHEMLRCIGRGSYGWVWLARNLMGVYRAVKIVYRDEFESSRPFERELNGIRKFEPISRSHAGFVDVLHIGRNEKEGCFYYVMELADDETQGQKIEPQSYSALTLSKRLSRYGRLPVSDCVKLGLDLSQALSELHRNRLVHRDVKPANIVFCDGVPKLADIGLVAESNKEVSYVGTEGFIPPEGPGSAQADIYSLGKVLYEAATGKDRLDFPEMPADFNQMPDAASYLELNEVILKACETKAGGRYENAWDMHADLVVLANGKSVQRLRALERGFARLKRVASISAVALVCLGIFGFEIYRGMDAARKSKERLVGEKVANWTAATESGDMLGALVSCADALVADQDDPENNKANRLRFGSALAQCPKLTYFGMRSNTAPIYNGQFSPDGTKAVVARYGSALEFHDLATGSIDTSWPEPDFQVSSVAFSADGLLMATALNGNTTAVWDVAGRTELHEYKHKHRANSATFSTDGKWLVVACNKGCVEVVNVATEKRGVEISRTEKDLLYATFSHDGRWIATGGKDRTARLYKVETGEAVGPPLKLSGFVHYVAFSPDDKRLAVASDDHTARIYEITKTGARLIAPILKHHDVVMSVEYSPDGRLIVTASLDGTVGLWTAEDLSPLSPNPKLQLGERAQYAGFDAEGSRILALSSKGTTRVFDLAGCLKPPAPYSLAFSQDKTRFMKAGNGSLQVFDTASGKAVSNPVPVADPIVEAGLDAKGQRVIVRIQQTNSTDARPVVMIYDVDQAKFMGPALPLSMPLSDLAVSPDGHQIAAIDKCSACLWEIALSKPSALPIVHGTNLVKVVWSPDSTRVATLSTNQARIWDLAAGKDVFGPINHSKWNHDFCDLQFSPDGSQIVLSEKELYFEECFASVWSARTGKEMTPQLDHSDGVLVGLFSKDGKWIATGGEDNKARVWAAATRTRVSGPLQHENKVKGLDFSSDSRWLATASYDRTARVWRAGTGEPLTPPLSLLFKLEDVRFLDSDHKLAVTTIRDPNPRTLVWDLPTDMRPMEDIQALARFLNGTLYRPSNGGPGPDESLASAWSRLRTLYPRDFSTTKQDLIAWHHYEADLADDANGDGREQSAIRDFHRMRLEQLEGTNATHVVPSAPAN